MNTDNLFEQMANISKASAYDIVSKQAQELKEENDRLKEENKALKSAKMELFDALKNVRYWYEENGFTLLYPRTPICFSVALSTTEKYSIDLGKSFEKLKEDMREEENDDLKHVNI